jgi:predicted dehydrogenase
VSTAAGIGVGIVGLSAKRGWAKTAHLPALRALEGFEVVALSASSEDSAAAAGEAHGVGLTFGDTVEMVARPEVDLVVVTVIVPAHLAAVSAALEAGKDVHCEWPLGVDHAEAARMHELATATGARGTVGLQARSLPVIRFLADYVAAGELGEVLSTTVVGSGERWGSTVPDSVLYLIDRDNGATMLTIPFGHTLDAVCHCLGELSEVAAVTATRRPLVTIEPGSGEQVPMTAEDQVAVSGLLQNGAVASLHYRGGRSPGTNFLWEIEGSRQTVVLTGRTGHLQYGRVELAVGDVGGESLRPLPLPNGYAQEIPGVEPQSLPYAVAQAYARLRDEPETVPTFADAVIRHHSLAAIQAAALEGTRHRIG